MLFFSAMSSVDNNIALIGFGEAASAFAEGYGAGRARHCRAYDIKTDSTRPGISESKYLDYKKIWSNWVPDPVSGAATDCVLAGHLAGVDQAVLETLERTYPGFGWEQRADYMLERMMTHGVRRAAEMREVASTLRETGLGTALVEAAVQRQQQLAELGLTVESSDYRILADQILESLMPAGERNSIE